MSLLRVIPAALLVLPAIAMASPMATSTQSAPAISSPTATVYASSEAPAVTRASVFTPAHAEEDAPSADSHASWTAKMVRPCVRTGNRMVC